MVEIWAHKLCDCGSQGSRARASIVVAHRLSMLHGMWNPSRLGIEPMYPALAGGFLSTAAPGKS